MKKPADRRRKVEKMKNKIMLLEDDASLIDGLRYSLKKNGFDIDFVRTVQEALSRLVELHKYRSEEHTSELQSQR